MDSIKLKVRISVVLFIVAGFFAGVMAEKYLLAKANDKPVPPRVEVMDFYSTRLNMTPEQKAEMGRILDQTSGQYDELRKSMKPKFDEVRNGARQRIRAILTPEQQPKYDELVQQRDAMHQQQKNNK
jgi:Spy/CpxP family protein refolding chaperone